MGYVKSSGNRRKLQNFNNRLINKYINKTEFAYDLDKGQYVKLKCKGINEVMGSPTASSCKLVN